MPEIRIAYLIGQYPAINHVYLMWEVQRLRQCGVDVRVASVAGPDRPFSSLSPVEASEAAAAYYIKASRRALVFAPFRALLRRPLRYARALAYALALAPGPRAWPRHLFYFAEAAALGEWMLQNGIGHVHAHFSAAVALMATRLFPVSMSFTAHGYGELLEPVRMRLARRVAGALFVRAVSKYARSMLMLGSPRECWEKLEHVPLGIEPAGFPAEDGTRQEGRVVILSVGRLAPEKGHTVLLSAMARAAALCPGACLRLVGDGPDRSMLEDAVSRLGLARAVDFAGWVRHDWLGAEYRAASIFVLASFYEGIPVVLMEAMCSGLPCVAPRITGIPELIRDGVDGLLFDPGDEEQLGDALARLAAAPELRRSLGSNARNRVLCEYNVERNAEKLAAVFRSRLPAALSRG